MTELTPKQARGRPCRICTHEQSAEIHQLIHDRIVAGQIIDFRNISDNYGMAISSVSRHVSDHLKLQIEAAVVEGRIKRAVDVYEEFCEQLEFAKELRFAARNYLADVNDPLRLSITPKAHEIEVTYFDHNDMELIGFGDNAVERPKKKAAQLSVILESLRDGANMEPDKFKITTIDIRKFALDAINTTDACIDKFAKMGGDYTKERENPTTAAVFAKWVDEVRHLATPGLSAIEFIAQCDAIGKGYPVLVERVKDGSIEIAGVQ